MELRTANKATTGGLGAAVTGLAIALLTAFTSLSPENAAMIGGGVGAVITGLLVYLIPNKPKEETK